jgi:glycosyltransferase involved in cell wall biosynthesis
VSSFTPQSSTNIRSRFGLNKESKIICFGADWSTERKGTDLLYDALSRIEIPVDSVHLVVFGHADSSSASNIDIPTTYTGFVDENTLRDIYSTADLMVVPSRQEAFGQTASEALASGTPVVAFDATGLQDIVLHKKTGYLAKPFDPEDLANGIDWILADRDRRDTLSENAREDAIDRFSLQTIAAQYRELYNQIK